MKRITLIVALCLSFSCFAQIPNWQWAYNYPLAFNGNGSPQFNAVDNAGNVYLAGSFSGATLTAGTETITNAGVTFSDIFLIKYSPAGWVLWAKSIGGIKNDDVRSITTDSEGNLFIIGGYTDDITLGSTTLSGGGGFFAKLDAAGNFLWARSNGGDAIKVDNAGYIYMAGSYSTESITFDNVTLAYNNVTRLRDSCGLVT